jgi:hypothetical protein
MRFCLVALLLLPMTVTAAVYRSVDSQGNVTFSDQPGPGAEEVKVPEPSSYSPPRRPGAGRSTAGAQGETEGYSLSILQPQAGADIRADGGSLAVEVAVSPDPAAAGHRLMAQLGAQPAQAVSGSRFMLADLDRGAHKLTVWIEDAAGQVVGGPQSVDFRVMRGADLFHPQTETQGEGPGVQQAPRAPMAPRAPRPELPRQYAPVTPPSE